MDIKHQEDGKKGVFYIEVDGKHEAKMTYTFAGSKKIIIDHTEVSDKLKGQGVGNKLVDASVEYMRANGLKAIPLCPFANAIFKKKGNLYADVLA